MDTSFATQWQKKPTFPRDEKVPHHKKLPGGVAWGFCAPGFRPSSFSIRLWDSSKTHCVSALPFHLPPLKKASATFHNRYNANLGMAFFLYLTVRGNEIQRSEKLLEGGFEWEYGGIGGLLRKRKRKDILSRENSRADVKEKKAGLLSGRLGHGLHDRWEGEDRGRVY